MSDLATAGHFLSPMCNCVTRMHIGRDDGVEETMARKRKRARQQDMRWIIAGAVVAVAVLGILIWGNQVSAARTPMPTLAAAAPTDLDKCGSPECGQADAPVTVEVYADFQCPYCAQVDAMLPQLVSKYIDTGKVRLVYRNLAFIGPESEQAALAARCAADQSKFWTFGNYLFTHQGNENSGTFSRDNLKRIAVQVGLDASKFNSCLDSGKYSAQVQQETSQGGQRGVQATPTFFVNGQKYEGVLSFDQLSKLIDARLPQG
jgi:protein-disulfide isomerase